MSTPIPSGSIFETRNYVDTPRPFKSANYARTANRRTKTLKQILAAERETVLGIKSTATGKRKGKRSNGTGTGTALASRQASMQVSRAGTEELVETPSGGIGDLSMTSEGGLTMEQVEAAEAAAKRKRELPTYSSVEAPPSLRPRKKFCDITGLLAPYTDPKTNLRYHSVEMYEIIKTFGPGVDQAYLSLRGESSQIK